MGDAMRTVRYSKHCSYICSGISLTLPSFNFIFHYLLNRISLLLFFLLKYFTHTKVLPHLCIRTLTSVLSYSFTHCVHFHLPFPPFLHYHFICRLPRLDINECNFIPSSCHSHAILTPLISRPFLSHSYPILILFSSHYHLNLILSHPYPIIIPFSSHPHPILIPFSSRSYPIFIQSPLHSHLPINPFSSHASSSHSRPILIPFSFYHFIIIPSTSHLHPILIPSSSNLHPLSYYSQSIHNLFSSSYTILHNFVQKKT